MFDIRTKWYHEWVLSNPILRKGEPSLDSTSGKLKIGDGRTPWVDLQYVTPGSGGGSSVPAGGLAVAATENPAVAAANPDFAWLVLEPAPVDATVPTISTFTGTPGNTQVSLAWSGTDNVAVTRWVLRRGGTIIYDGPNTSYNDTGRTNGTPLSYTVTAYDAAGNTTVSSTVNATPTTAAPPSIFPSDSLAYEFVASDLASTNNAAVATLPNRVSGGVSLISGDGVSGHASSPTYRTDLRSLPVIAFDGVDDFMGYAGGVVAQPRTRIFIGGFLTAGASKTLTGTRVAGANRQVMAQSASTKWNAYAGTNLPSAGNTDTGLHMIAIVFNGASSILYVDGVMATGNAGTEGANGLRIGAGSSAADTLPTGFTHMVLGEIAGYSKAMTSTELDAIRVSAKARWNDLP